MEQKPQVLIVEDNEDWQRTLRQAFNVNEYEVHVVRTPDEAQRALDERRFDLAVVDPLFDSGMEDTGDQDAVQGLLDIMGRDPDMRVIVVTGSIGQARLAKAPGVPCNLPVVNKNAWDRFEFADLVRDTLSAELGETSASEISQPSGEEPAPMAAHYSGMTGPLFRTGLTGPLSTGLVPPPVGTRLGRPRVLIIDGNPDWQHQLAQAMDIENYFWRVAPNYQQAMERLRLESFHVVVLDLRLDEPDTPLLEGKGWQLLEHLVANCPKTKVIVASGEASRSDVARLFMRYPIKGFVDKDAFRQSELLALVREQLGGPSLRIQMLGDFRVWRDGVIINTFGEDRAETVLKILLTRRGSKVSVEELVEYVWPGSDPRTASTTLGALVNSVRAALEPDIPRPNDSNFILRSGGCYLFNILANVEVDAEQLRRLILEARQHERSGEIDDAIREYEAANAIYLGDFLPGDRSEQWAMPERSALQSLYTDALNRLADLYAERRQLDQAIDTSVRSLQVDAYIESTYRRLMRYHTCRGDRNAALNVYRSLVKLFSEFFGEEPEALTQHLYEDIQAERPVTCVEASAISGEWRVANDN
jgi:DNA-binding SARP family transcriptional activator/ActR/RegA family two-component response regulator